MDYRASRVMTPPSGASPEAMLALIRGACYCLKQPFGNHLLPVMTQSSIPFIPSLPLVVLSTDGGCKPNPGAGAWAYVLRFGTAYKEQAGACPQTTNNRMELRAIIEGLKALKKPCRVIIKTDSKVSVAWITNKIGKKVARDNPDIAVSVGEARKLCALHTVTFEWVRGHAGEPDNERCDSLCAQIISPGSLKAMLSLSAPVPTEP